MPAKRQTEQKGKHHSARVIAQALALLIAGESVQFVADKLGVPKQTVSDWKELVPADSGQIRTKKEVVEDLLGQYLEQALRANLKQLEVISDPNWIAVQNAADLATLHGVVCDKVFRLLEAAHAAEQRAAEQRAAGQLSAAPSAAN